jgi:serralysin
MDGTFFDMGGGLACLFPFTRAGATGTKTGFYVGGADTFMFMNSADSPAGNGDVIKDFTSSQLDKIDLSAIDANAGTVANDAFSFIGSSAFTGTAGELRFANGILMADLNGDHIADFEVTLNNVTTLSASNLLL